MDKQKRKKILLNEIKRLQDIIKDRRKEINTWKRELDFINGHYDKTWEEEFSCIK